MLLSINNFFLIMSLILFKKLPKNIILGRIKTNEKDYIFYTFTPWITLYKL